MHVAGGGLDDGVEVGQDVGQKLELVKVVTDMIADRVPSLKMVRASRRQLCLPPSSLSHIRVSASLFSADRTGLVDWASLSLGGSIVSTPLTTTHPVAGQELTVLGWSVWQVSSSPSQILKPVAGPGQCWALSGQAGQVVMQLGKVVTVMGVTIEHVKLSPDMYSAPHDTVVWGPSTTLCTHCES